MGTPEALRYVCDVIRPGDVHPLRYVLRRIQGDWENAGDYLLKQCRTVAELGSYLGERYGYLFVVENRKVARCTRDLEDGREGAERYFSALLAKSPHAVKIDELKKMTGKAPNDVKIFMETFYPHAEFRRFLKRRPHIFAISHKTVVDLIERESAKYFQQALETAGEGAQFMSLRGRIGQAPNDVRNYINEQYPGAEFRHFLEMHSEKFLLRNNGSVYLA